MRIYGQSFSDVFAKLPWPYRIVVAVGTAFVFFVIAHLVSLLLSLTVARVQLPEPLEITAQQKPSGVFDPSLSYDPASNTAWLAFSAEDAANSLVNVRLASSQGGRCGRWEEQQGSGFESKNDELVAPDGQTSFAKGIWRIETPSLVYDPGDKGKEWKLFAYKYFWAPQSPSALSIAHHYGAIVYKYASDPSKEWSPEQWLFSAAEDYPPAPYAQMVLLQLDRLDPSLKEVITYSRPSVIAKDGALYMTLSAFTGKDTPDRIVMISSADHGQSWKYLGATLRASDLAAPYTKLAGATLLSSNGQVYLAAVPGDAQRRGEGTLLFAFDDISRGILQRDPKTGAPVPVQQLPLYSTVPSALGGGFAAYSDACSFGLLTGEQAAGADGFQIFKTYQSLK